MLNELILIIFSCVAQSGLSGIYNFNSSMIYIFYIFILNFGITIFETLPDFDTFFVIGILCNMYTFFFNLVKTRKFIIY